MKGFSVRLAAVTLASISLMTSFTACHRGTSSDDETPDTSTYRPESTPATQFERDLKYVRDAHFAYVWIFSRKDGKELTPEDSDVLRTNASKVVDWVKTDKNRVPFKVAIDEEICVRTPKQLVVLGAADLA